MGRTAETASSSLLPTPLAKVSGPDYARQSRPASGGDDLVTFLARLFPTPRASDGYKGSPNQRGSDGDRMLPSALINLTRSTGASTRKPSADGNDS